MSGKRQAEPLKLHVTYKAALRDVFSRGRAGTKATEEGVKKVVKSGLDRSDKGY